MKKIICTYVCMLLIATTASSVVTAGDEENPEIRDYTNDAQRFIDIRSAWFHENPEDSDFIFISLKITNLYSSLFGGEYGVFWSYNGVKYGVHGGIDHVLFENLGWRCGEYHWGSTSDIQNMADCEATVNRETGIITWNVPKDQIGDPQQGDSLTQTYAHTGFEFVVIKFLRFIPKTMDSASDLEGSKYGGDYTIQY